MARVEKWGIVKFALILGGFWSSWMIVFAFSNQTDFHWYIDIPLLLVAGFFFGLCMWPVTLWTYRRTRKKIEAELNQDTTFSNPKN